MIYIVRKSSGINFSLSGRNCQRKKKYLDRNEIEFLKLHKSYPIHINFNRILVTFRFRPDYLSLVVFHIKFTCMLPGLRIILFGSLYKAEVVPEARLPCLQLFSCLYFSCTFITICMLGGWRDRQTCRQTIISRFLAKVKD